MLSLTPILAAMDPTEIDLLKNSGTSSGPKLFGTDVTIILAVSLGLAALLFFWAFFLRKKPTHARGSLVVERTEKNGRSSSGSSSRKRRRRRSESEGWGRNPTLSETGGLPPPRPEEPETPPAQQ